MKLYRLERVQALPVTPAEAWPFFSSPSNLPSLTPPWLKLRVVGDIPARMFPGMVIPYRVKPVFGLSVAWITEITHVEEPRYFVDEQRFGPYRFWQHQHRFSPRPAGLEMTDKVHYGLRYGPLGRLLHALIIRRRLEAIFDFRFAKLERIFEAGTREEHGEVPSWPQETKKPCD